MLFGDLLKISKWMALGAIFLCSLSTLIAYFSIEFIEGLTVPLLVVGVFLWVLSVIWFLWGWLKNANEESNERKGISASSYILIFLPICYGYLLATDKARTKVSVSISTSIGPLHSIKVFGTGSIFLDPDTNFFVGLTEGKPIIYKNNVSTAPHMKGDIQIIFYKGPKKYTKRVAGPFSINPMNLKQDWAINISEEFLLK